MTLQLIAVIWVLLRCTLKAVEEFHKPPENPYHK